MDYKDMYTGEILEKKPEYMTSLWKNELVYKNHPRIVLRGYLDELKSKIILYMNELYSFQKNDILKDFEEVLTWIKLLQRSEVTEEKIEEIKFNGMDYEKIRQVSHDPQKFYGIPHLFDLDYKVNSDVLKINQLKSFVRRIEIAAFNAYFTHDKICREDFLTAINRLSSVLYIVELKILSGESK